MSVYMFNVLHLYVGKKNTGAKKTWFVVIAQGNFILWGKPEGQIYLAS